MKIQDNEITVANRFIYYYANFVERIYGFVIRRGGKNIPDEHYIGRMQAPLQGRGRRRRSGKLRPPVSSEQTLRKFDPLHPKPPQRGRWGTDPQVDEIILFRYRKRLMLGYCQEVLPRAISAVAEDRRRLKFHRNNLVYLTGVTVTEDRTFLRAYADSVRALSDRIDLQEIWELVAGDREPLMIQEIAGLCWADEIDASRWVALYLYLDHACPYFETQGADTYVPVSRDRVGVRRDQHQRRQDMGHDWEEFVHWLAAGPEDPHDPDTLTERQLNWLEDIRQYALWGGEARGAKRAKQALAEVAPEAGNRQRIAFEVLVRKGIWEADENLDLIRNEIPLTFPESAVRETDAIDLDHILKTGGRRKLRRHLFAVQTGDLDAPEIAFSLKRRWLGRGYELGVHIPDVASLVPAGSDLDRGAADRMAALLLPDRHISMLPSRIADDLARLRLGEPRPALSVLWKLSRNLTLKSAKILPTVVTNCMRFAPARVDAICEGEAHLLRKALGVLDRLTEQLCTDRKSAGAGFSIPEHRVETDGESVRVREVHSDDRAHRIVRELAVLAAAEIGTWCVAQGIPTMYEIQDAPEDRETLNRIPDPTVRRHEIRRQTPPVGFSAVPERHSGLGVTCCPIINPGTRYPDLMVQRQVIAHLLGEDPPHSREEMDTIRYRAQEELQEMASLQYYRERHLLLKHLSSAVGKTFPAVVLYLRRDGALVELVGYPLKTVVRPSAAVEIGEKIRVCLSGVDLWEGRAHFGVALK